MAPRIRCPICNEVSRKYDNNGMYHCKYCDLTFHFTEYTEQFDDDIDDEAGCRACGNPAYPNCKSSCPLYD